MPADETINVAAQVIASRKQLEVKYENASKMADEWKERAKLALEKGA